MCLGFLQTDVADEVGVGDLVVLGGFSMKNTVPVPLTCLFGNGASYTETMGEESTPFICKKGAFPDGCVRTEEELGKGALFAGRRWSGGESGNMMSVPLVGGALG